MNLSNSLQNHRPTGLRAFIMSKGWAILAAGLMIVALMPLAAIIWIAAFPEENIWPRLAATVLPRHASATVLLLIGSGALAAAIGVAAAWLVTMCRTPGGRMLEWALLLPLAMPGYIVAYTAVDLLEYAGPVQGAVRAVFGFTSARDYWFPQVRSLPGAVTVMALTLYPYVYITARSAFLEQSVCVLEASRTLGRTPWNAFWSIALPLARPSIVVGVALVMMEGLNDYGTIEHFDVPTLTAGVFDIWQGEGNAGGAAQLVLTMLAVVLLLLWLERRSRGLATYGHSTHRVRPIEPLHLNGWRSPGAVLFCVLPILLGFVLPVWILLRHTFGNLAASWSASLWTYAFNSLLIALVTALIAVLAGLAMAYAGRLGGGRFLRICIRTATIGYAIPGAVLAVGILIPFGALDNGFDSWMRDTFGFSTGLMLTGSIAALVFALTIRFLALAFGAVEAGLGRVTPSMDMAARTLGRSPGGVLRDVHLPMIRGSILAAGLLVFVDVMKELPATLLLRPFNFDTLATHVYTFASLEQLDEAALAALLIVVAGIGPVVLLSRAIARSRPASGR